MEERSVIHSTFVIERSYPATAARVFAAFADPAIKRRWFVDGGGHEVNHYEMDFKVGGGEHARFRFREGTPLQGMTCANDTTYQDIVLNRRVVFASAMAIGGKCISASLVTVELLGSEAGADALLTHLVLTHQGAFFEGADGPEMREAGWRQLMDRLMEDVTRS